MIFISNEQSKKTTDLISETFRFLKFNRTYCFFFTKLGVTAKFLSFFQNHCALEINVSRPQRTLHKAHDFESHVCESHIRIKWIYASPSFVSAERSNGQCH